MKKIVLLAILLAGCTSPQSSAESVFPAYRGHSVNKLLERWGDPLVVNRGDFGPVYVWDHGCRFEAHTDRNLDVQGIKFAGKDFVCREELDKLR